MASNKGKYISVGQLHYRSDLDDKKQPARTYRPGDTIEEDLEPAEVERLLKRGAIREVKVAQKEQKAREEAAQAARQAEEAAAAAKAEAERIAAGDDGLGSEGETRTSAGKKK